MVEVRIWPAVGFFFFFLNEFSGIVMQPICIHDRTKKNRKRRRNKQTTLTDLCRMEEITQVFKISMKQIA